jgi:hypothetical protein
LLFALAAASVFPVRAQTLLAHGINPANLGKGDWIYQVSATENRLNISTTQDLINYEAGMGMQWITVKCADGSNTNDWSQFSTTLIAQAHAAGLKIFGWAYIYGSTNVPGEINAALACLDKGADGFVMDAEGEYEAAGQTTAARQYCQGIRARYPDTFLAYAPVVTVVDSKTHPGFPGAVFGYYCDAVMPQAYWAFYGDTPAQMIASMDGLWTAWQNGLTGTNRQAIKPLIPIAETYSYTTDIVTGTDITDFVNGLRSDITPATPGGYHGVSFWNSQTRNTNMDSGVISVVTLSLSAAPTNAPQFSGISLTSDGVVQLELSGQMGSTYAIDISSNLLDWVQLATFTNSTGSYQFMDGSATNRGQGYYRARWLSP